MAYVSLTNDFTQTPWLGELPLYKGERETYKLDQHVPPGTKEVLVYIYVTVRETSRSEDKRAVYEIYSEDAGGCKYSQFMNVVFTTSKDFVMNSANMWLPVFDKKEITISIPDAWSAEEDGGKAVRSQRRFRNLDEAMRSYAADDDTIFTGVNLLGYR